MNDGIPSAGEDAAHALGTDAACQAACGFSLGAFIVVAAFDLHEVVAAHLYGQFGHRYARLGRDLAAFDALFNFLLGQVHSRQFGLRSRFQSFALQVANDG